MSPYKQKVATKLASDNIVVKFKGISGHLGLVSVIETDFMQIMFGLME